MWSKIRFGFKVLGALAGLVFLWWLYRSHEDPAEVVVSDMDFIDSDGRGEDD